MTGAVDQKEVVLTVRPGVLRLVIKRPDETHKRGNSGYRGEQEVIRATAGGIERKTSLGRFSQCNFIAHLKWVREQARRVYYGAVFKAKKEILAKIRDFKFAISNLKFQSGAGCNRLCRP